MLSKTCNCYYDFDTKQNNKLNWLNEWVYYRRLMYELVNQSGWSFSLQSAAVSSLLTVVMKQ